MPLQSGLNWRLRFFHAIKKVRQSAPGKLALIGAVMPFCSKALWRSKRHLSGKQDCPLCGKIMFRFK